MKVLAIGAVTKPLTDEQQQHFMPKEVPDTLKLYLDGKIDQLWFRMDKVGVIFLMNAESVDEAKAATDKLAADMATELGPYGVAVVSLYPGLVRTEKVMESANWLDLTNSESPEFIGRAVAALAGSGKRTAGASIARAGPDA